MSACSIIEREKRKKILFCRPSFRYWEEGGGNFECREGCRNGISVALEMSVEGVVLLLSWTSFSELVSLYSTVIE